MQDIIEMIAAKNGVTPEEVRREMEQALKEARASSDLQIRATWEKISINGEEPASEDVVGYAVAELIRRMLPQQ